MIVYAKHLDLLKSANKNFIKLLSNPAKIIEAAEKQIRVEVNHTHLRSIRQRFDCGDVYLKSVLSSGSPVNHNFLKKILGVSDVKQTSLFDELETFKCDGGDGMQFIIMMGIQTIIVRLEYNEVMVKSFFSRYFQTLKHSKIIGMARVQNSIQLKRYWRRCSMTSTTSKG